MIEIGDANGKIVMYLNESGAKSVLKAFESQFGNNDAATQELKNAIYKAYPKDDDDDE